MSEILKTIFIAGGVAIFTLLLQKWYEHHQQKRKSKESENKTE